MSEQAETHARRRTAEAGEVFLDHAGWFVPELESAGAALERLGFVLTAYAAHHEVGARGEPVPTGTGNRCALLEHGYLELIAAVAGADTPLARQQRSALRRGSGIHLLAIGVADPVAAHTRLQAAGMRPLAPVHLERPVMLAGQRTGTASFTVIRVAPESMPEGRIQLVTHHTPELVWGPESVRQPNGIAELSGALVRADDLAESADRFGRFLGREPITLPDAVVFALDRGVIVLAPSATCSALVGQKLERASAAIAAVSLRAPCIAASRDFLQRRGVPLRVAAGGSLCIDAAATLGATLLVHEAESIWSHA